MSHKQIAHVKANCIGTHCTSIQRLLYEAKYYGLLIMEEHCFLNGSGLYFLTQIDEESSFLFHCCQNIGEVPPSQ